MPAATATGEDPSGSAISAENRKSAFRFQPADKRRLPQSTRSGVHEVETSAETERKRGSKSSGKHLDRDAFWFALRSALVGRSETEHRQCRFCFVFLVQNCSIQTAACFRIHGKRRCDRELNTETAD